MIEAKVVFKININCNMNSQKIAELDKIYSLETLPEAIKRPRIEDLCLVEVFPYTF
jgi:hypothetical protein